MSDYRIEFRPAALRELRKIDRSTQPRIQGAISLLAKILDLRPHGRFVVAMVIDSEWGTIECFIPLTMGFS